MSMKNRRGDFTRKMRSAGATIKWIGKFGFLNGIAKLGNFTYSFEDMCIVSYKGKVYFMIRDFYSENRYYFSRQILDIYEKIFSKMLGTPVKSWY